MSEVNATVAYDGPALQDGTMDVRDLAPALLAVGELCERANAVLYGRHSTVKVNIKTGFKRGSFVIDLVVLQGYWNEAKTFLNSDGVNAALNLAGIIGIVSGTGITLFKLFRWLRGKPPQSATTLKDGSVQLTIDDSTLNNVTINVSSEVVKLYNNPDVRAAARRVVAPLEREGIDVFEIRDTATLESIDRITRDDLPAFIEELAERPVTSSTFEAVLQIVKPSFDEEMDMQWMFSDGNSNFWVVMKDLDFLEEVRTRRRRFAKGDLLRVSLHVESFVRENGEISNRRTILKVMEQIEPPSQIALPE